MSAQTDLTHNINAKDIELAQYLNAKFCHELAGTLGAISNGVEFLDEANASMKEQAIELVKASAQQAINRLMFYRQAYGISKVNGEADLNEFKKLTLAFLEGSKVKFDFAEQYMHIPGLFLDVNIGKLLYCFINIAINNLIYGGSIILSIENNNKAKKIIFKVTGKGLKNDEEKNIILLNDYSHIIVSTSNIHNLYTRKLADKLNARISIKAMDDSIDYIIEQN